MNSPVSANVRGFVRIVSEPHECEAELTTFELRHGFLSLGTVLECSCGIQYQSSGLVRDEFYTQSKSTWTRIGVAAQ